MRGTESDDGNAVLRIDVPGRSSGDRFEDVSWGEWFETFDDRKSSFIYQEHKASGEDSTFFKLVRQ